MSKGEVWILGGAVFFALLMFSFIGGVLFGDDIRQECIANALKSTPGRCGVLVSGQTYPRITIVTPTPEGAAASLSTSGSGLGISRDRLQTALAQPEFGVKFETALPGPLGKRTVGANDDASVRMELAGPDENLREVIVLVHRLPGDQAAAQKTDKVLLEVVRLIDPPAVQPIAAWLAQATGSQALKPQERTSALQGGRQYVLVRSGEADWVFTVRS
jgi:hypothetical protein